MSKLPEPIRMLSERIREIEEQLRRQRNGSPFAGTGMHPTADNGIASDNFDGDLDAGDPGTTGWAMDADQAAFGELILRPGSIGNDSLTNPLLAVSLHDDASNFAVSTAWSYPLAVAVTVPAGFTQALITNITVSAAAHNTTAAEDVLYTAGTVVGHTLNGWAMGSPNVPPGGRTVAYDLNAGLITGLTPGATLAFEGGVITAFGSWGALGTNVANLNVSMLWLR